MTTTTRESELTGRPAPTSAWLVVALNVVMAACTLVVFVPFWMGISGLAWSNTYAWPLTYLAGAAFLLWLGCIWVYVKVLVWPRPTGTAANGAPRGVTLLQHLLSTTLLSGVVFMQVSVPAVFLVDMVAGTSAEQYSGWIVAAFIAPTSLALLSAAIFARPRLLMTDAMCKYHAVKPSEI